MELKFIPLIASVLRLIGRSKIILSVGLQFLETDRKLPALSNANEQIDKSIGLIHKVLRKRRRRSFHQEMAGADSGHSTKPLLLGSKSREVF